MKLQIFNKTFFHSFARFLWWYSFFIILWGAWVRISKSGDGCGKHWPLCHGEVIPSSTDTATWIEFIHRATSGIYGFVVIGFVVVAFYTFPKKHIFRSLSLWVLALTITEALLGARLVLAGLVGNTQSLGRAWTMMLHLINSLLLVGVLTLAWDLSSRNFQSIRQKMKGSQKMTLLSALIIFLLIASSGALASLSTTLFPSLSLWESLAKDFSLDGPSWFPFRMLHPILGLLAGGFLVAIVAKTKALSSPMKKRKQMALWLLGTQVLFGFLSFVSLSPLWMKLTHLGLALGSWGGLLALFSLWLWPEQTRPK